MAHTLLLIRHAKAVQDAPSDEQRVLAPRGASDSGAAGRWLLDHDLVPDLVIVSPAHRARQTWEAAASVFAAARPVTVDARVYDNTIEALLSVVHDAAETVTTLALVGHNPSIHGFAVALDDGSGDARSRTEVAASYPTAGIAVFDIGVAWNQLAVRGATLRDFAVARG